jgi:hypothetical protein
VPSAEGLIGKQGIAGNISLRPSSFHEHERRSFAEATLGVPRASGGKSRVDGTPLGLASTPPKAPRRPTGPGATFPRRTAKLRGAEYHGEPQVLYANGARLRLHVGFAKSPGPGGSGDRGVGRGLADESGSKDSPTSRPSHSLAASTGQLKDANEALARDFCRSLVLADSAARR